MAFALPSSGAAKTASSNIDPASNPLGGNAPFASGAYQGLSPNQLTAQGYYYDLPSQQYKKSPTAIGQAAGQVEAGFLSQVPSLSGLTAGATGTGTSIPSFGGGTGTAGAGGGTGTGAPGAGGSNPTLSMPDQSSVTTNAFNAAKDRAAQQSRASLTALNGELGATGMMGGGAQVQGASDIINSAGQYVSDVNRQASTTEAQTAADFAKTGYEGGIAQRGQDIAQQTAYRGQDVQYANAQSQLALAEQQANRQYLSLILQGLSGGKSGSSLY